MMDNVVFASITHAAETQVLPKYRGRSLNADQISMVRCKLNFTRGERISDYIIRSKTRIKDLTEEIKNRKGR